VARLDIQWQSQSAIAPTSVTTGDSSEAAEAKQARAMVAEKPMMVYVMSDDQTDSDTRKLESVAFKREQVGIGSKFFDCFKMTAGDAAQDRVMKQAGKAVPRIVFLNRDYTIANVLEGSELSGGGLLKAMEMAVRQEYVTNFDTMVRDYISLLNELDRLESRKAQIEDQKRRLAEKPNKSREKKIAHDEDQYKSDMEAWEAKESKIKELKRKGDEEKPATDAEA
jgi:hypothetical protein